MTISQLLFEGPVVPSNWRNNRTDSNLVRLGILWKLYRFINRLGPNYYGYLLDPYVGADILWKQSIILKEHVQGLENFEHVEVAYHVHFVHLVLSLQ